MTLQEERDALHVYKVACDLATAKAVAEWEELKPEEQTDAALAAILAVCNASKDSARATLATALSETNPPGHPVKR